MISVTLCDLAKGEDARVRALPQDPEASSLCVAMGLSLGATARLLRRAPFGGPLHVRVGEIDVAIGRDLAALIMVDK